MCVCVDVRSDKKSELLPSQVVEHSHVGVGVVEVVGVRWVVFFCPVSW